MLRVYQCIGEKLFQFTPSLLKKNVSFADTIPDMDN
jgi:hypothetical protein